MGDGRRASPSCRPWKDRKTRFRTGRVLSLCCWRGLAFINRPTDEDGGGGLLSSYPSPHLSGTALSFFFPFSFLFLHFLNSFLFQGMCAASRSNAAPAGVYRGTTSAEGTQGPPVAGHRGRSKAGMKGGNTRWLYFPSRKKEKNRKALSSTEITLRCTCKAARIPKQGHKWNAGKCWWSAAWKHLALHVVTYLHSPFPLEVASHHPPFRHDSVGREHFRPVEQMKNIRNTTNVEVQTVKQDVRIKGD